MNKIDNYNDDSIEILYQTEDVCLIYKDQDLVLVVDDKAYQLSSHPYEPCLYIKFDNKIITIIHNSFDVLEIIQLAKENGVMRAITGEEYDIKRICKLLVYAVNNNIFESDIGYLEKRLAKDGLIKCGANSKVEDSDLKELIDDPFYNEYEKYKDCVLDYCIIKIDAQYNYEKSHKEAVIFALEKWGKHLKSEYDMDIFYNPEKMKAIKIEAESFFELPSQEKSVLYNNKPYWYLFLKPPHGNDYNIDDFIKINNLLFPNGTSNLEIYEWSTNWSNYFDEGLEWWGARCISIYDKNLNRFVVIGASATD